MRAQSKYKEPLIRSRVAATSAFRDGMREARCSQWPPLLASRATKQTARKGAPDSDSRSVEREGAQAAARNTAKTGRLCCRSRTPSFADRVAGAPDSVSRSVVLAGAQKAAFDNMERSLCGCSRKRALG